LKDRSNILTEQRLEDSRELDAMSVEAAVTLMHAQDLRAVEAVGKVQAEIARAVKLIVPALRAGGRLIYVGAGTSGRLGVLDASECPPTFRTDPNLVQGIIAGGPEAMFRSQEGAEDRAEDGERLIDEKAIAANDVVVGIAAGGTTPYVHGALRRARARGTKTIFIACVEPTPGEAEVDVAIRPLTGPEVVTGSTRLKAGTATKLVLNMLSTLSMVQLGKVYGNLMVDLRATNDKLWDRGARIVSSVAGIDRNQAMVLLKRADGHVKAAIVMHVRNVSLDEANKLLLANDGKLRSLM
jgi:N-acetylmuramic acid 6-phosphate etherase